MPIQAKVEQWDCGHSGEHECFSLDHCIIGAGAIGNTENEAGLDQIENEPDEDCDLEMTAGLQKEVWNSPSDAWLLAALRHSSPLVKYTLDVLRAISTTFAHSC